MAGRGRHLGQWGLTTTRDWALSANLETCTPASAAQMDSLTQSFWKTQLRCIRCFQTKLFVSQRKTPLSLSWAITPRWVWIDVLWFVSLKASKAGVQGWTLSEQHWGWGFRGVTASWGLWPYQWVNPFIKIHRFAAIGKFWRWVTEMFLWRGYWGTHPLPPPWPPQYEYLWFIAEDISHSDGWALT